MVTYWIGNPAEPSISVCFVQFLSSTGHFRRHPPFSGLTGMAYIRNFVAQEKVLLASC